MRRAVLALSALVVVLQLNALDAFFLGDDFDFLRLIGRRDTWAEVAALEFWGEWEPLWYLSWSLDMATWGYRAFGFHLTNTLWLILAVVALYGLVRELWPRASIAPWAAALLFATHPIHDEAVVYLAARGHLMCTALMIVSCWLYARSRREGGTRGRATGWIAGALAVGLLAALSKETALVLPAWIATMELFGAAKGRVGATLARRVGIVVIFALAVGASLFMRQLVVGLDSEKLTGAAVDMAEITEDVVDDLPAYALLGGLPVPFAQVHEPVLLAWRPLGWILLVAVACIAIVLALRSRRDESTRISAGLVWLGIVIAITALAPVFWADLPMRRRYLLVPSVGIVLMAAPLFEWLRARWTVVASSVLGVCVLAGGVMSLQRHQLYRRAGEVNRNLIESVRGAPLGSPARAEGPAAFVTLPGRYGGDSVSGVYLVHHTDLSSALTIFDVPQREIAYGLRFYHADDLSARVLEASDDRMLVRFSFATARAYEAALEADPADEGRGDLVRAERVAADDAARTLDYEIRLSRRLRREGFNLFFYSDGAFEPLPI